MCKPMKYKFLADSNVTGKLYERNWFALMALKGCRPTIQDMWIGFNMSLIDKFDDFVMYLKVNDEEVIFCMQVKSRTGMLQEQQFTGTSGDFSLSALQSPFKKIKGQLRELLGRDVPYICGFVTCMAANTEICGQCASTDAHNKCGLAPCDQKELFAALGSDFFDSRGESRTLKFDARHVGSKTQLGAEYLTRLLVCSSAAYESMMTKVIRDEIRTLARYYRLDDDLIDYHYVATNYLSFIADSVEGRLGGWNTLTRTVVAYKLLDLMTWRRQPAFLKNLTLVPARSWAAVLTWNYLTVDKNVIVAESTDCVRDFVRRIISYSMLSMYPLNEEEATGETAVDKTRFYSTFGTGDVKAKMLETVGNHGDIRLRDLYAVFWKLGKIAVLFQASNTLEYRFIINALKMVHSKVIAIILLEFAVECNAECDSRQFKTLEDLRPAAKSLVLRQSVRVQGRGPVKLEQIIGNGSDQYRLIGAADVITIITGTLDLGKSLPDLPKLHIARTVPRIGLAAQCLRQVDSQERAPMFLVRCESGDAFDNFVSKKKFFIFDMFSDQQSLEHVKQTQTDTFDEHVEHLTDRSLHYLILHASETLEWIKSHGTVRDISRSRIATNLLPVGVRDIVSHFSNSVNIISADPGSGKTVLMHYLSLKSAADTWVLPVDLNKYMTYYESEGFLECSAPDHLRYFNDEILGDLKDSRLHRMVFENLLRKKRVVILLDGLDEIAPLYTKEVTSMALSLRQEGYQLWLTTRPVLREHVETTFDTFALTLTPLSVDEQSYLLTRYFTANVVPNTYREMKMISKFVATLLQTARECLNEFDNTFMGVPLQIMLLVTVFGSHCHDFVRNGYMHVMAFDLLDLYDNFTKMKIAILVEKFGRTIKFTHKNLEESHRFYALKVLFTRDDLGEIGEYVDKKIENFMNNVKDATEKAGIVVAEVNINFVHRSVSEYFAAKWLSENLNTHKHLVRNLLMTIFEPNFYVIRNVFDRILAKGCRLITAVINQQFSVVEQLLNENKDLMNEVDSAGRNALCIAAAWSEKLSPAQKSLNTDYKRNNAGVSNIIKLLLDEGISYLEDPLLNMTPLDYALKTNGLKAVDSILGKYEDLFLPLDVMEATTYLRICVHNNYLHLAEKILTQLNSPFFLQIDAYEKNGLTPLMVACENGDYNMAALLLKHNANPALTDKNGRTVMERASSSRFQKQIANLLRRYGLPDETDRRNKLKEMFSRGGQRSRQRSVYGQRMHRQRRRRERNARAAYLSRTDEGASVEEHGHPASKGFDSDGDS